MNNSFDQALEEQLIKESRTLTTATILGEVVAVYPNEMQVDVRVYGVNRFLYKGVSYGLYAYGDKMADISVPMKGSLCIMTSTMNRDFMVQNFLPVSMDDIILESLSEGDRLIKTGTSFIKLARGGGLTLGTNTSRITVRNDDSILVVGEKVSVLTNNASFEIDDETIAMKILTNKPTIDYPESIDTLEEKMDYLLNIARSTDYGSVKYAESDSFSELQIGTILDGLGNVVKSSENSPVKIQEKVVVDGSVKSLRQMDLDGNVIMKGNKLIRTFNSII